MTMTRLTDEQYDNLGEAEKRRIIDAAMDVAIAPAVTQKGDTFAARVPWKRIHSLRAAFTEAEVDWQEVKGPDTRGV